MELNELTRERLTDDRTYKEVKDVAEGLTRAGRLPACDLLQYIKLAEYETREKDMNDEIEQAFRQGYSKGYEKAAKTISMLYEVERLEDKHWNECRQIALYDDQLRKAMKLLESIGEIHRAAIRENCGLKQLTGQLLTEADKLLRQIKESEFRGKVQDNE